MASTPRGGGGLFDFKELDLHAASRPTRPAAEGGEEAEDEAEEDPSSCEHSELHPEGLPCIVVALLPVLAAPRNGSTLLGTLKAGSSITVYEVRGSWARHVYDVGPQTGPRFAWSAMSDALGSCLIQPLEELTEEERWILGDFSAPPPAEVLPVDNAEPDEAEVTFSGRDCGESSCSGRDEAEDCYSGREEVEGTRSDGADAESADSRPEQLDEAASQDDVILGPQAGAPLAEVGVALRAFGIDLLDVYGQPPARAAAPERCKESAVCEGSGNKAADPGDFCPAGFAHIPPEGLECIVVCRSWVPVRLAPTYWSKMVGCLKAGAQVTVYEISSNFGRHEFSLPSGAHVTGWSSVVDPHHGKLIRPVSDLTWKEKVFAASLRPSSCSSPSPGAIELDAPAPAAGGCCFADALGHGLAALGVSLYVGPAAVFALRAAARDVGSAVAELVPLVQQWCPSGLYVLGGFCSAQQASGGSGLASWSVERLHPVTGAWEPLPRMLQRRAGAAAAALGGRIYICGGSDGQVELRTAERLDPLGGLWEPIAHLLHRRDCAAAAAVGHRLYVCGGSRSSLKGALIEDTAEVYDPETGVWKMLPSMLEKRVGAAAAGFGGRFCACGGMGESDDLRSAEAFDPEQHAWELLPPMRRTRYGAAIASLGSRLYVCGGTVQAVASRTAECFDGSNWNELPAMLECRSSAAAASVGGKLYVVGGKAGPRCLASVEVFDPRRRAWTAAAPMQASRRGAAAVAAGAPLQLRVHPGSVDELSQEQLGVASMWEGYNRRAALHLRDNAL